MPARLGVWGLGLAVLGGTIYALVSGSSTPALLGRGVEAPAFELPRVGDAGQLRLADLAGKVVLVNFWATWCKPCEDEMPAMERLYRSLGGSGFELVAISVDESEEPVVEFQKRLGLSFPIALDSDQVVASSYQTFRFPESLLIGRDGLVVERYVGSKDWDGAAYVARIRELLSSDGSG
jgi:peroxiredoxin